MMPKLATPGGMPTIEQHVYQHNDATLAGEKP